MAPVDDSPKPLMKNETFCKQRCPLVLFQSEEDKI